MIAKTALQDARNILARKQVEAAAPDLLAALKAVLAGVRVQYKQECTYSVLPECEDAAHAAIAKAEGKV